MIEFKLWKEEAGDNRISIDPAQVVYFSAVEKRVAFGGNNQCTKITLATGESFVVTATYDAVMRQMQEASLTHAGVNCLPLESAMRK